MVRIRKLDIYSFKKNDLIYICVCRSGLSNT